MCVGEGTVQWHSPRYGSLVYTTRDFHWMISISPLPHRTRLTRVRLRPTLSHTTLALRQVILLTLRIRLRGLSIHASRYNALPRHKYADIGHSGLPQGLVSLDVDDASVPI